MGEGRAGRPLGKLPSLLLAARWPLRAKMPPQAGSDLAAVGKLPSLLNRAMGAAAKASSSLSSSPGSSVSANAVRAAATAAAAVGAGAAAPPAVPRVVFSAAVAPGHRMEGHVEQPARVETILRRLREAGITGGACAGQVRPPGEPPSTCAAAATPRVPQPSPPPACPPPTPPCPPPTGRQVVELPAERRLPLEAARAVHSYVDQLAAAQARAVAEGRPQPVADIGDPGEGAAQDERAGGRDGWPVGLLLMSAGRHPGACPRLLPRMDALRPPPCPTTLPPTPRRRDLRVPLLAGRRPAGRGRRLRPGRRRRGGQPAPRSERQAGPGPGPGPGPGRRWQQRRRRRHCGLLPHAPAGAPRHRRHAAGCALVPPQLLAPRWSAGAAAVQGQPAQLHPCSPSLLSTATAAPPLTRPAPRSA